VSTDGPDYERVAAVLVRIGLRMVHEDKVNEDKQDKMEQEGSDADGGLLSGVDRGAGGRGRASRLPGKLTSCASTPNCTTSAT
jgi:hypothetical protein